MIRSGWIVANSDLEMKLKCTDNSKYPSCLRQVNSVNAEPTQLSYAPANNQDQFLSSSGLSTPSVDPTAVRK